MVAINAAAASWLGWEKSEKLKATEHEDEGLGAWMGRSLAKIP
jgi:hypothetical protein